MTQQEIQQEYIIKMLKIVSNCDKDLQVAYVRRNKALTGLNEWLVKAWKEATDVESP